VTSDDIMIVKLSISTKIHMSNRYGVCFVSFQMSTEFVVSRRELVANCVHTADVDATQLDSCVTSASSVCIGHKTARLHHHHHDA